MKFAKEKDYLISVTWRDITALDRTDKNKIDDLIISKNVDSLMSVCETYGKVYYLDKNTIFISQEDAGDEIEGVVMNLASIIDVKYFKN